MTAEDRAAHVEREAVASADDFEDTLDAEIAESMKDPEYAAAWHRIELREVIAEHRLNAVVEGPSGERTRVKCDGDSCDFYAEGSRYWDVVREHDAHLTDAVLAALHQTGDAAALARVFALADEWEAAGTVSVYESAGELGQILRAALTAGADQ